MAYNFSHHNSIGIESCIIMKYRTRYFFKIYEIVEIMMFLTAKIYQFHISIIKCINHYYCYYYYISYASVNENSISLTDNNTLFSMSDFH